MIEKAESACAGMPQEPLKRHFDLFKELNCAMTARSRDVSPDVNDIRLNFGMASDAASHDFFDVSEIADMNLRRSRSKSALSISIAFF